MTVLGITVSMPVFWIILAVIFSIIEAFTVSLTSIWFSGGSIAAMIAAIAGAGSMAQLAICIAVSCVLLFLTRPIIKDKLKTGTEKTNTDALIGSTGNVLKTIEPHGVGQVKVGGLVWSAVSEERALGIEENTEVVIKRIEGVKLVVTALK